MFTLINNVLLHIVKKVMINEKGELFYNTFKKQARFQMKEISPLIPDIGDSIFKSSYLMCGCYIAWYKAFMLLEISSDEANKWIWRATEEALVKIPDCLIPLAKKIYIGGMLKKAVSHTQKSKAGTLPEYDWKVEYIKINDNEFYLNTYECGIKKLAKKFHVEAMLPSLCRMDYLTSHYLKSGFVRTKTLGDGDALCNNKFMINGTCEWAPEKGFEIRK